jgi:hypothetical protein
MPAVRELDPTSHEFKPVILIRRELFEGRGFSENQLASQRLGVLSPFDTHEAKPHLSGSTDGHLLDLEAPGLRVPCLTPEPYPAGTKEVFGAPSEHLDPQQSANPVGARNPA